MLREVHLEREELGSSQVPRVAKSYMLLDKDPLALLSNMEPGHLDAHFHVIRKGRFGGFRASPRLRASASEVGLVFITGPLLKMKARSPHLKLDLRQFFFKGTGVWVLGLKGIRKETAYFSGCLRFTRIVAYVTFLVGCQMEDGGPIGPFQPTKSEAPFSPSLVGVCSAF